MLKRNIKEISIIILLIILCCLNVFKAKHFNLNYNILRIFIQYIILIGLSIICSIKLNKERFFKNLINSIILIIGILSLIFSSFNGIGMILLFSFLFLITLGVMTKTKFNYEISMVFSTSLLILFFIIIGLLNLLSFSKIFILIITILILFYLCKNKDDFYVQIKKINKTSLIIFSILFLVAILSGVGRYVHKWDEYSYWAFAAKVLINTNSFKMMISSVSSMFNYPPVSSIWHYIVSIFNGYSEPNLYMGLLILTFIYMMPIFSYCKNKKILFNILLIISTVCFPLLFDGSINYGLLYVDLLLGVMCGSVLVLQDYIEKNKLSKIPVYILLILIILLKPNGFVFSCCLIFLTWLKNLVNLKKINLKLVFTSVKKYFVMVLIALGIYGLWYVFANFISDASYGYMFKLVPDSLKSDILPKLNPKFLLNFINGIINTFDETILYSFINIPLFVFLGITLALIVYLNKDKDREPLITLIPYLIFYLVFLLLTAVSLFVMFSYYEASILASFTRYLAPINIALALFVIYKFSIDLKDEKKAYIFYLIIILLIGFSNTTFFITDISSRRQTIHIKDSKEQIFSVVNDNTEEDSKIYVLNQTDDDGIMPIWYARFYCYPRIVNASSVAITWKVKTVSNEWDLKDWGLNSKTLSSHLLDYDFDYLFLYSKTEDLYDELEEYFYDIKEAKKSSLFKIIKENDTIKLISIK